MSLNSCCAKVGCVGADDIDGITLKNFSGTDVDSIIVSVFKKDTDFKTPIDSFRINHCDSMGNGSFYMLFNYKMIRMDNDYRIYFPVINKIYEISGFKTSKAECGECIIKDFYKRLDAYKINLKTKSLGFIEIDKDFD
jgi:hypothetical protein